MPPHTPSVTSEALSSVTCRISSVIFTHTHFFLYLFFCTCTCIIICTCTCASERGGHTAHRATFTYHVHVRRLLYSRSRRAIASNSSFCSQQRCPLERERGQHVAALADEARRNTESEATGTCLGGTLQKTCRDIHLLKYLSLYDATRVVRPRHPYPCRDIHLGFA